MVFLKRYTWIITPLLGAFIIIGSAYSWASHQLKNELINAYIERARITSSALNAKISESVELFQTFHLQRKLKEALENPDLLPSEDLIDIAVTVSTYTDIDQVRLILPDGNEHLRVNDQGQMVTRDLLQNKSARTYFQEAMDMPREKVYLSDFNLNIEFDEIEYPIKPMVRIAAPVERSDGKVSGLFVLNFKLNSWFEDLAALYPDTSGNFHILNQNGYFLYTKDPEMRWGEFIADRKDIKLENVNPALWSKMNAQEKGVLEDHHGVAVWHRLNLDFEDGTLPDLFAASPMKIILYRIPTSLIASTLFTQRVIAAASFLLFSCTLLGLSWLYRERRVALNTALEAFDHAAIGMALVDQDGNFLTVNNALCSLIGYSPAKLEGKNLREVTHPDDREKTSKTLEDLMEGKYESREVEKRFLHQDGREIWVLKTTTTVKNSKGTPRYLIIQVRDLTERILYERQLIEANKNLLRSNRELEQFAYVASHDLQEPLRMVANYTELLAEKYKGNLDEKADKYISYAVDGAKRMQTLINDLLAYSRVGTRKKAQESVDCEEVILDLRKTLASLLEETETELTTSDLPTVWANKTELSLVFQNLVSNAIKFRGKSPSRIHITAEKENKFWNISVKDDGIGIDPQFHERIFTIFQRLNKRNEYNGSGIGLSIVKKIIEFHGGSIRLDSKPGKGATFIISLPAEQHQSP